VRIDIGNGVAIPSSIANDAIDELGLKVAGELR
jgi:molybdopterin-binding protein